MTALTQVEMRDGGGGMEARYQCRPMVAGSGFSPTLDPQSPIPGFYA
jgi:hypothetical protein